MKVTANRLALFGVLALPPWGAGSVMAQPPQAPPLRERVEELERRVAALEAKAAAPFAAAADCPGGVCPLPGRPPVVQFGTSQPPAFFAPPAPAFRATCGPAGCPAPAGLTPQPFGNVVRGRGFLFRR